LNRKDLISVKFFRTARKNTYWWIHDIKIKELSNFTKPNIQEMKYDFKEKGNYLVFLRAFYNRK